MPDIIISLEDSELREISEAFPEVEPEIGARKVAEFAVEEFAALLSGRRRYLSLSHQYIEWLEALNVRIIPAIELTSTRLMNQLNFPPGTASYIARVLRDRQNVTLVERSRAGLKAKLEAVRDEYKSLPKDARGGPGKQWSITLTKREYRQLLVLLDLWEAEQQQKPLAERESVNLPNKSEDRLDFIKITYPIESITKILEILDA